MGCLFLKQRRPYVGFSKEVSPMFARIVNNWGRGSASKCMLNSISRKVRICQRQQPNKTVKKKAFKAVYGPPFNGDEFPTPGTWINHKYAGQRTGHL